MKTYYVFSKLANDQQYNTFSKAGAANELPILENSVFIRGGAGIANKNFLTPQGVMSKITEDELARLKTNAVFVAHAKNGFITVEEKSGDADEVAQASLTKEDDQSSPLTPSKLTKPGSAPLVNEAKPVARK